MAMRRVQRFASRRRRFSAVGNPAPLAIRVERQFPPSGSTSKNGVHARAATASIGLDHARPPPTRYAPDDVLYRGHDIAVLHQPGIPVVGPAAATRRLRTARN